MDLTPASNTPPREPASRFPGSYAEYLKSPTWRKRRDAKLRSVGYRCGRCDARRPLEVHHTTYVRLGRELDSDLEVLCRTCHENHHFREGVQQHIGLYIKIAADVVQTHPRFESEGDLIEAVKVKCARARVPYNTEKLTRAVWIVCGKKPGIVAPREIQVRLERGEDVPPPTHAEALNLLRQLNIRVPLRSMPAAPKISQFDRDRIKAMRFTAQEIADSIARCEELEKAVAE